MQTDRSCIVREAVIDREYRVSPPARWDTESRPRQTSRSGRSPRRRRRSGTMPLVLLCLTFFFCGFLLGHAIAAEEEPAGQNVLASGENGEQEPVRTFDVIGAVRRETGSGKSGDAWSETNSGKDGAASGDWNLRLVNSRNPLPEDFAAPELTQLMNGHAIDKRAYPDLQAMMDAARAEGYQPLICSSFRTWDKQAELFRTKTREYLGQGCSQAEAEEQAAYWVARPGTSEHQLGLAVDIVDKQYQLLDQAQEERPVQQWLMEHCADYGFILRYPTEKSELTGVGYEPWHYRYVGRDAAKVIMSAGICLEEYLNS